MWRHFHFVKPVYHLSGGQSFFVYPLEHLTNDSSLFRSKLEITFFAGCFILWYIMESIRRIAAKVLFANFHFMTTPATSPINNHLALEFGKASEDIDHQVISWAFLGRQLSKNYIHIVAL